MCRTIQENPEFDKRRAPAKGTRKKEEQTETAEKMGTNGKRNHHEKTGPLCRTTTPRK
jgi:hypothetical protein